MKVTICLISIFILLSCDYRKSASVDVATGIITKGEGLSCDNIYLSDGINKLNGNSFAYGQKVYLNFVDVEGFKKEQNRDYPGMSLLIVDKNGDTIMHNADLYADNQDGFDLSPLQLQTKITVANPMRSNNSYTAFTKIWDKKSNGLFDLKMDFNIIPNSAIKIEKNNITYNEIYLFSKEKNTTIIDDNIDINEHVYMLFEGLSGFTEEEGMVAIGLSLKAKDARGELILNEEDLIGESPMNVKELNSQLAPNFVFSGTDLKNPITCEINIWDKKSDKKITATIDLNIKQ